MSRLPKNFGIDRNVLVGLKKNVNNPSEFNAYLLEWITQFYERFEYVYKILFDEIEKASGSVEGAPELINPNWRFNVDGDDLVLEGDVAGTWTEIARWSRS